MIMNMYSLVVLATGVICLLTSLVGYTGIMLNNRAILTVYNLLLWPCFGIIAAIGYTAYRKNKWNLEGKLSYQWHYKLNSDDRARIQANVSPSPSISTVTDLKIASLLWLQVIFRLPRKIQSMLPSYLITWL